MIPPAMAASSLSQTVDLWTAQVMVASGFLTRLYRALGDDRQAAKKLQAPLSGAVRFRKSF